MSKHAGGVGVLVVAHTHWDREWYLPFQVFRFDLVRVVDEALDLLETDPAFHAFTLDGQAVILEDYLEIRPGAEQRLRTLVQAGRLLVGPWYVQPDEFLSSGEALIRNLLVGRAVARRFGQAMAVGYCPDSFGHIAQLPQLLQGFGIDSMVFSRGLGDEGEELGSEFAWAAPDGSVVLAIRQIGGALDRDNGYYNAAVLGHARLWGEQHTGTPDAACARRHAGQLVAILRRHARTPYLLFNNGGDHLGPQRELPRILDGLNTTLPGVSFRQSTYPEYVRLVRSAGQPLPRWRGELRGARYTHVLAGVLSARMGLKQANARVQTLLERWAEPFSAFARLEGAADARPFLRRAWKHLLLNHAHDSICGCSIDQVQVEMQPRFDQAEQIARQVGDASVAYLAAQVSHDGLPSGPLVHVFNATGSDRSELASGPLSLPTGWLEQPLIAVGLDGAAGPCQVLGVDSPAVWEAEHPSGPEVPVQVGLVAPAVPGVGYGTFAIRPGTATASARVDATGPELAIDNDRYRVTVVPDGRLRILHRPSGHLVDGAHLLVDEADAGDTYTYAPLVGAMPITTDGRPASVSLVHDGPAVATVAIEHELWLPAGLSADRQRRSDEQARLRIRTEVSLAAGARWVDVRTELDNGVLDHRLRMVVPTGVSAEQVEVLGHFDRVTRRVTPPPRPEWLEPPGPSNHHNGYVAVHANEIGVALLSPELPEYLAEPGDRGVDLSLTLLRCIGWLSRSDLPTRRGPAGPALAAPGAQCAGRFRFRYAVAIYSTDERPQLPVWAESVRTPLRLLPATRQSGRLPPELAFLRVEGQAVLTTVKIAEDDETTLIARLFNPGDAAADIVVRSYQPLVAAWRARLDETPIAPLPALDQGRAVRCEVGARQVLTLRLRFRESRLRQRIMATPL